MDILIKTSDGSEADFASVETALNETKARMAAAR